MKWFSKNWWWLTILAIGAGVGYYIYKKNKPKGDAPPGGGMGGGGGGISYTNVDNQENPLLKLGTMGQKVQDLQVRLIGKGYKIASDKYFGPITEKALKEHTGKAEIQYIDIFKLK